MSKTVKLMEKEGEICAQIPFDYLKRVNKVRKQAKGSRWNPGEKLWHMHRTPLVAFSLLEEFEKEIEHCDESIYKLAKAHSEGSKTKASTDLPDIPKLKTTAWTHQRQGYHFAKDLPGVILSMDMGTGKTLTSLGLLLNRNNAQTMVVCPKSVITVWPAEFKKHCDMKAVFAYPIKGSVKKKTQYIMQQQKLAKAKKQPFILILNYEAYWREPLSKWIEKQIWDHIIYDECHRIKSPSGKAARFASRLVKQSQYRLGLTGTPMPHSPLDVFAQARAIDPSVFGTNYHKFKTHFAIMGGFNNKQIIDYQNQEELSEKFDSISFRVKANDVLDLPEAIHTYRTCQLTPKTWKVYKELDSELYTEIEQGEVTPANAMVKVLRLQQLTSGYLKTDNGDLVEYGTEKKDLMGDLLDEIPQDEPIVIFCRFTSDIENVKQVCLNNKRNCGELSGSANDLEAFQKGQFDSLAIQIRSGGVGVDLTRSAYCIYYSMGHSLGDYTQSLARTNRPGQTRSVRYYHLLADDSIDMLVYKALQEKQEVIDFILEQKGKEISEKVLT